ncbi:MAG: hypothetical protein JJU33_09995 [Phycisphaerales bacterium]|nr:hypothetical protein [Phycisphaerales bacterium]
MLSTNAMPSCRSTVLAAGVLLAVALPSCGPSDQVVEIQHEHPLEEADFSKVDRRLVERVPLGVSPTDDGRVVLHIYKAGPKPNQDIDLVVIDPADGSWTAFSLPFPRIPNPDWASQLVTYSALLRDDNPTFITHIDIDKQVVRVVSPVLTGEGGPLWANPRISGDGTRVLTTRTDFARNRRHTSAWMLGSDPADATKIDEIHFLRDSLRWTHDDTGYFVVRYPERDPRTARRTNADGTPARLPALDYGTTSIDRHDIDTDRFVRIARLYDAFHMGEPSPCGRYIAGSGTDLANEGLRLVGFVEIDTGRLRWIEVPWLPHPDGWAVPGQLATSPMYAWRSDGERFLAMVRIVYGSGHDNEYFVGEFDPANGELVQSWEVTDHHTRPIYHTDGTIIIPRIGVGLETLNADGSISLLWSLDSLFAGP